ncbi:MAG: hypothetical protein ACM3IJ_04120 [Candidatus Levyibacteriota bacterium]
MEVSKSGTSVKLKGKNASLVIDPTSKAEAEIVIATAAPDSLVLDKVEGKRLVIAGPGEYEVGGISVTGITTKNGIIYQILDGTKVMFAPSSAISQVPDDEDFDCLLVKVVGELSKDALGPINTKCVILFGDTAGHSLGEVENAPKINLKKTAEIAGKTFVIA